MHRHIESKQFFTTYLCGKLLTHFYFSETKEKQNLQSNITA